MTEINNGLTTNCMECKLGLMKQKICQHKITRLQHAEQKEWKIEQRQKEQMIYSRKQFGVQKMKDQARTLSYRLKKLDKLLARYMQRKTDLGTLQ